MTTTERAEYVFTVKEYQPSESGVAQTFLACEPSRDGLSLLNDHFLAFDLRDGTTVQEAQEIAKYLQEKLSSISITPG